MGLGLDLKQSKRRLLVGLVALTIAVAGIIGPGPDGASAMKCWQPDGRGTPFVCTAP